MLKLRYLLLSVMISALTAGCASDQARTDAIDKQAERIAELELQSKELAGQLVEIFGALDKIQEGMEHAEEEAHEVSAFDLAVAQYVMDAAGFHDIDVAIGESGSIDPSFLSVVAHVQKVLSSTTWPEELGLSAEHFLEELSALQEALRSVDAAAAAPLAASAHTLQHDLSQDIDAWIGGEDQEHDHDE
jgi:uncharacterized protein YceK